MAEPPITWMTSSRVYSRVMEAASALYSPVRHSWITRAAVLGQPSSNARTVDTITARAAIAIINLAHFPSACENMSINWLPKPVAPAAGVMPVLNMSTVPMNRKHSASTSVPI